MSECIVSQSTDIDNNNKYMMSILYLVETGEMSHRYADSLSASAEPHVIWSVVLGTQTRPTALDDRTYRRLTQYDTATTWSFKPIEFSSSSSFNIV